MIDSVLDRHSFRTDSFLAGYACWSGEDAAVVILVAPRPTSRIEREKWGTRFLFFLRPRSTEIPSAGSGQALRWESLACACDSAASG